MAQSEVARDYRVLEPSLCSVDADASVIPRVSIDFCIVGPGGAIRVFVPLWKRSLNQIDSSLRRFASGKSDGAFLDRLYEQMLGRRPDVGAVSNGMRNLSRGFLRRNSLRKQIISSSEYRAVTPLREIKSLLRYAPAPATARSLAASSPEEIWLELPTRWNTVTACEMC